MNRKQRLLVLEIIFGLLSCIATASFAGYPVDSITSQQKTNMNLIHTGTTTATEAAVDEDYQKLNLFPCPPDLYCVDINNKIFPAFTSKSVTAQTCTAGSRTSGTSSNCTISAKTYSSAYIETHQQDFCPNMCTVSRTIVPGPSSTEIVATKPALCPKGYAQVGMSDANKEVLQGATGATVGPTPTIAWSDYTSKYQPNNYTCTPAGNVITQSKCATVTEYKASNVNCTKINAKKNTNTGVGQYESELGQYKSCTTPYQEAYNMGCYVTNNCTSFTTNCVGSGMYVGWTYTYQFDQCVSPNKSLYYSGYAIPTTIICARIGYKWQNK